MNMDAANKELKINYIELFWTVFEQWKAILLCVIVCAVLFGSYGYYSSYKDYQRSKNKSLEDELKEKVSSEDMDIINEAVEAKVQLDEIIEYKENSVYYNLNPKSERVISVSFLIEDPSGTLGNIDLQKIRKGYTAYLDNIEEKKVLADGFGWNYEDIYSDELISTDIESDITDSVGFKVDVICPDDDLEAALVEQVITSEVEKSGNVAGENAGKYTLTSLGTTEMIIQDAELTKLISEKTGQTGTLRKAQDGYKTTLAKNENAMNLYKLKTGNGKDLKKNHQKPGISKKYIFAGIVMGIGIYVILFFAYTIVNRKLTSVTGIEYILPAKYVGTIRADSGKSGGLFSSKWVRGLRYKKGKSVIDQINNIKAEIDFKKKHSKYPDEKISYMSISNFNKEEEAILNSIANGSDIISIDIDNRLEVYKKIDGVRNTIVILKQGDIEISRFNQLLETLDENETQMVAYFSVAK